MIVDCHGQVSCLPPCCTSCRLIARAPGFLCGTGIAWPRSSSCLQPLTSCPSRSEHWHSKYRHCHALRKSLGVQYKQVDLTYFLFLESRKQRIITTQNRPKLSTLSCFYSIANSPPNKGVSQRNEKTKFVPLFFCPLGAEDQRDNECSVTKH